MKTKIIRVPNVYCNCGTMRAPGDGANVHYYGCPGADSFYLVRVKVDPIQRKFKRIAWSLLGVAALGLGLIASGYALLTGI